ncbi:MAG: hypothetical protein N2C14_34075, partial [Planctomycetales bacterium]
ENGKAFGKYTIPFDASIKYEFTLRSPMRHVPSIRRPTFYFEGTSSTTYVAQAARMHDFAESRGIPFQAFPVRRADHFNILDPLTKLIAKKILADVEPDCNISFTNNEVQQAFRNR